MLDIKTFRPPSNPQEMDAQQMTAFISTLNAYQRMYLTYFLVNSYVQEELLEIKPIMLKLVAECKIMHDETGQSAAERTGVCMYTNYKSALRFNAPIPKICLFLPINQKHMLPRFMEYAGVDSDVFHEVDFFELQDYYKHLSVESYPYGYSKDDVFTTVNIRAEKLKFLNL